MNYFGEIIICIFASLFIDPSERMCLLCIRTLRGVRKKMKVMHAMSDRMCRVTRCRVISVSAGKGVLHFR